MKNLKASMRLANMATVSRPRIVLAGDNPDIRDYLIGLLAPLYEVESVPDGKAALSAVHRQVPDLIIADVMMPQLDGVELLRLLREDQSVRSIPVILLSDRAGDASRIEGMAAGADDYLVKPFSAREILVRVDSLLKMAHLRAEGERALRESEAKLAIELSDAQQLQRISSRLIEEDNIEALYEQILDTAMAIMSADFSSIQMLDAKSGALHLLAWKNFHPESAAHWQTILFETGTTCGLALKNGERVIVSEVKLARSGVDDENLRYYELSGIVAVQSTPLITRNGRVIGMLSTHWRQPHQPSERELRLLDVLVRQASDPIERRVAEEALRKSEEKYRTLFESINEGFALIEVIFNDVGKAVDYHFLETNQVSPNNLEL